MLVGAFLGRYGGRRLVPRPWWETRPILVVGLMTLLIGLPMTVVAAIGNNWIRHGHFGLRYSWDVLAINAGDHRLLVVLVFLVRAAPPFDPRGAPRARRRPTSWRACRPSWPERDLWAVEAEDHYLRLHTSRGQDLILMRLADAIVELEGIEGARTHRSWWVARDAVVAAERADGRATLTLTGGAKAPVSRAYVKPLREAGWF